ncbi:hypothetical protein F4808DRAFT_412442 [Astrocystis sublimbata]|nr:hypothetical protein F4808DRAFT_412442 [Astrocystis sublimbata]
MALLSSLTLLFVVFGLLLAWRNENLPHGAEGPRRPSFFEAPDFHLNIDANDNLNAVRGIPSSAEAWVAQMEKDFQTDPVGTIWNCTEVVVLAFPGLVWRPPLTLLGFGVRGVVSGTAASARQSAIGTVPARSPFSFLQSAGAGGYASTAMNFLTRGVIILFKWIGTKWVDNTSA